MRLLLPYPIAILRLMLSYGPMPTLPGLKRDPVVVVAVAVDDSLAERSSGLQYQKIRLLCSKTNPVVVAAFDDDIPVE